MSQGTAIAPTSADDFAKSWEDFLVNLERVSRRQLRRHPSEAFRSNLLPLLNRVFVGLRSEDSIRALTLAVAAELREPASVEALGFLQDELNFYNAWQGESMPSEEDLDIEDASQIDEGEDSTEAVDAGKTIKDSAEKLIKKLPQMLQNALNVLNEILSIVRGGS